MSALSDGGFESELVVFIAENFNVEILLQHKTACQYISDSVEGSSHPSLSFSCAPFHFSRLLDDTSHPVGIPYSITKGYES